MRIQGPRIAKITAKHSPAVHVIEQSYAGVSWMLRGACRSPSFSIKLLAKKKTLVHPSISEKKTSGLRPCGLGLMQGMERWF
jgi:hypothetical protein